jgi:hypothetical protein
MLFGYVIGFILCAAFAVTAGLFLLQMVFHVMLGNETIVSTFTQLYENGLATDSPVELLMQITWPIYAVLSAGAILFVLAVWVVGAGIAIGEWLGIVKDTSE